MEYIKTGARHARAALEPVADLVSPLFSKTAARALLTATLAALLAALLLVPACVGYLAFYREYLPDQVVTVPVHLQYGYEPNPYGTASLARANLKDYQDYDITVTLDLPNSPANLARGNFMLALYLVDDSPRAPAASSSKTTATTPAPAPHSILHDKTILFASARPAIMPYTDPLVSLAKRLLLLAYHVLVPCSETTRLAVPMAERLLFSTDGLMPAALVLDVQAGQGLHVYDVSVTLTARLGGLRWFMHTWRVTSFVLFAGLFWAAEVVSLVVGAVGVRVLYGVFIGGGGGGRIKLEGEAGARNNPRIKQEGGGPGGHGKAIEDDVPMTFPTSSQQPPLRYDPEHSGVDERAGGGAGGGTSQAQVQAQGDAGGEADVEEDGEYDEEDYRYLGGEEEDPRARDSGVGTSFSERDGPGGSGGVRRRTSLRRMGGGGGGGGN